MYRVLPLLVLILIGNENEYHIHLQRPGIPKIAGILKKENNIFLHFTSYDDGEMENFLNNDVTLLLIMSSKVCWPE